MTTVRTFAARSGPARRGPYICLVLVLKESQWLGITTLKRAQDKVLGKEHRRTSRAVTSYAGIMANALYMLAYESNMTQHKAQVGDKTMVHTQRCIIISL